MRMRLIDADALVKKQYLNSEMVLVVNVADIRDVPTVDAVEVKHGRWIMRGGKLYCSVCGKRAAVTRDSDDYWYTKGTDCCPNCGAKMDTDENE